jgi:hypothetical protein
VIQRKIKEWKRYYKVSETGDITHRYFVMNAFDGVLTMLGVVIGAYTSVVISDHFQSSVEKSQDQLLWTSLALAVHT